VTSSTEKTDLPATIQAPIPAATDGQYSRRHNGELVVAIDVVPRFKKLRGEHEKLWKCHERGLLGGGAASS
jgi:hypothetical protein